MEANVVEDEGEHHEVTRHGEPLLQKINTAISIDSLPVLEDIGSMLGSRTIDWQPHISEFTSKKMGEDGCKHLKRKVRKFYKTQDELIDEFEDSILNGMNSKADLARKDSRDDSQESRRIVSLLSKITFFLNLLLLIMKVGAAVMSGSLSVISTVIDSAVDLISGALIWWSMNAVKKRDIYKYPQGFTRIEPVVIVVLAVIMAVASMQMVRESGEKILELALSDTAINGPEFSIVTLVICSLTIVIKLGLYIVCRRFSSPSMQALALDHRNDVLSNTIAVICGYIGGKYWPYADPMGAIAICLYIIMAWFSTGWEQIKMLTGLTASPDFLKRVTWLCLNHNEHIELVDTVRAFHFGNNYLVEIDIVLPRRMFVEQAHDIAESLQRRVERMKQCERCFVHVDVDGTHCPTREHKIV